MRIKKDYKQTISLYDTEQIRSIKKEIMSICLQKAKEKYIKRQGKVKVSVVLPIYNAEPYLRECLDSVVNQTLKDIEIICVNDGSTDNSLNIIKEYAQKDIRVKYIDKPNAGYGQTMNCGIDLASGEYIGIVEPDDFIKLEMYETLYNKAKEFDLDIVKGNLSTFSTVNKKEYKELYYLRQQSKYNIVGTPLELQKYMICTFNTCSAVYKKSFLLKNKITYNETPGAAFQDTSFWFKTHCCAKKMMFINDSFYFYRQDNPNQSIHNTKIGDYLIYEYASIANWIKQNHKESFAPNYFYRKLNGFIWYASKLNSSNALEFYKKVRDEFNNDIKNNLFNIELLNDNEKKLITNIMNEDYSALPANKIKVSVIIPVYNTAEFLPQCLDSVINQTLKEIEIICINDGSTDNSLEILKEYAAKDKRIIIINQKNQKQGAARNKGLKIARGEYIQFVDSDDWLSKNALSILYNKAHVTRAEIIHFEGVCYYVDTQKFDQVRGLKIEYVHDINKIYSNQEVMNFILNIPISACLFFYENQFIKKNKLAFPEQLCFEDNYFCHKALNAITRYVVLKEILYNRTKHSQQTTANWDKYIYDYINVVRLIINFYTKEKKDSKIVTDIINQYCKGLCWRYKQLKPATQINCRAFIVRVFKEIPATIKLSPQIVEFIKDNTGVNSYKKGLQTWYQRVTGKYLNLDNPRTFNEKIQWLKLYDSTPIKTRLADKYLVRDWVKEKIGEQYLIPLLDDIIKSNRTHQEK